MNAVGNFFVDLSEVRLGVCEFLTTSGENDDLSRLYKSK